MKIDKFYEENRLIDFVNNTYVKKQLNFHQKLTGTKYYLAYLCILGENNILVSITNERLLNFKDHTEKTLGHLAVYFNNFILLNHLINIGFDITTKTNKGFNLMSYCNSREMIKYLISLGFAIKNNDNNFNLTLINGLIESNSVSFIDYVFKKYNFDYKHNNINGMNYYCCSMELNRIDLMEYFEKHGLKYDLNNDDDIICYYIRNKRFKFETFKYLVSKNFVKLSIEHLLEAVVNSRYDVIKYLSEKIDILQQDPNTLENAFSLVAFSNKVETVYELEKYGFDPCHKTKHGLTAWHISLNIKDVSYEMLDILKIKCKIPNNNIFSEFYYSFKDNKDYFLNYFLIIYLF